MKDDQLYQELKHLAEKMDMVVAEHNFRHAGISVNSGFCIVKGQKHCIIDKHVRMQKKIDVLAECLAAMPHEHIYVVPAVRKLLESISGRGSGVPPEAARSTGPNANE